MGSIKPYQPPPVANPGAAAAAATAIAGSVIETANVLSFPFYSLHSHSFIGVIINAPLSDDPTTGITPTQLATLPLPDCLASDAIVGVWAQKQFVGPVVQCMSSAWGCKYVENLTWVHLSPGGDVARGEAPFTRASHSTLVMGRRSSSSRGGGELELRHQRSADVIVEAVRGGGRFPDAAREMLETLLPVRKKGKKGEEGGVDAEKGGGGEEDNDGTTTTVVSTASRFLEVALHGAEVGVRPGWVKVVQG